MMSQRSKREMIEAIRPRYLKANRAGKEQILDEFMATTGYHRKYAIRVLKHGPKPKGLKKTRPPKNLPGRSGQCLGTNLGNLWADLFEKITSHFCQKEFRF